MLIYHTVFKKTIATHKRRAQNKTIEPEDLGHYIAGGDKK
jgi:hypothetical protein